MINRHISEWKAISLRECLTPCELAQIDTPSRAADFWRTHIATDPHFNGEVESLYCLHLNTRKRITGFHLVATGLLDSLLAHPREIFRTAIVANCAAIVMMHNHPSGDPAPSEADIKCTRDIIRAGQLLKIEVVDHVVVGNPNHASLREMGFFYA